MDCLSDCPSLVDILKLLNVADNSKCKLVNRRIRDVMRFNRNNVKPTARNIHIRYNEMGRCNYLFICLELCPLTGFFRSAIVTGKMILLRNTGRQKQLNFFGFRGVELSQSEYPSSSNGEYLIARFSRNTDVTVYKNNSVEEGLRQLLSGVLDRCHFDSMILENEFPAPWLKVIADTFEENRSKCRSIETQLSPGSRPLIETLCCSHLNLISHGETKTLDNILAITGCTNIEQLNLFSEKYSSPRNAVILFLQSWQAGCLSMNRMMLSVHAENSGGSWTDEGIVDLLSKLDMSDVREMTFKEEVASRKTFIKRMIDNKTIQLTVSDIRGRRYGRIVDFKEQ